MSFRTNSKPRVDIGPQADRPANPSYDGMFYVSETGITAYDDVAGVWRNAGGSSPGTFIDFYADSITGNDANPGTAALPVQTIFRMSELAASIPYYAGVMRLHFAPGTYSTGFTPDSMINFLMPGRQSSPFGSGPTLPEFAQCLSFVGAYQLVSGASETVTATSTSSIPSISGFSAPDDSLAGFRIRMLTGGPGIPGTTFLIRTNFAAGGVIETMQTVAGIAPGDTFVVERPSVFFTGGEPIGIYGIGNVAFVGIQSDAPVAVVECIFNAESCIFSVLFTVQESHVAFRCVRSVDPGVGPVASIDPKGSTGSAVLGPGGIQLIYGSAFGGPVVLRNSSVFVGQGSTTFSPDVIDMPSGSLAVFDGCVSTVNPNSSGIRSRLSSVFETDRVLVTLRDVDSNNINLFSGSEITLNNCTVIAVVGNAIAAQGKSRVTTVGSSSTITGPVLIDQASYADLTGAVLSTPGDLLTVSRDSSLIASGGSFISGTGYAMMISEGSNASLDGTTVLSTTPGDVMIVARGAQCEFNNSTVINSGPGQAVNVKHHGYVGILGGANNIQGGTPTVNDFLIDGTIASTAAATAGINGAWLTRTDDGA